MTVAHSQTIATLLWIGAWAAFSFWDWVEIVAAVLVSIGCVGEMYWIFKKGPPKESFVLHADFEEKKGKRERVFAVIVAIGVTVEVITLPRNLTESAQLASANLVLRSNVAALELQVAQTSSNVTKADPLNQPITLIKANALMFVRGTNASTFNIDPVRDNHFVTLSIANRAWAQKRTP